MVSAPARREQVRHMVDKGLSERRALAQRHRRYGIEMLHLKLRQGDALVQARRAPLPGGEAAGAARQAQAGGERQPLMRPLTAN